MAGRVGDVAGGAAADLIAQRWLRWMTPSAEGLSNSASKLERLQPLFERALAQGPAAVAALHAQLRAKSSDYRKALSELEE